jgi:Ca2+-binding RTX toxin-like protein
VNRIVKKSGRRALPVLALFGALSMGLIATNADAAIVTASEFDSQTLRPVGRFASAQVKAQPAEANRLSVTLGGGPGRYLLQVRDDGEAITAGSGCSGGGAVGSVVSCVLGVQPGSVTVVLGNGGATLDAGTLPGSVFVWAGAGNDSIVTGSGADAYFPTRCGPDRPPIVACDAELRDGSTGEDRILTGAGDDWAELGNGSTELRAGPDDDWAIANASANGPDTIDLEDGGHDVADYRLRQQPLTYFADELANDGESGEGDAVLNAEYFAGGNGDDLLVGDASDDLLFGASGADLLIGNAGDDWLIGEQGREDDLGFVKGVDITSFRFSYPIPGPLDVDPGADRALGGEGDDRLYLDKGSDTGYGGPGDDQLRGDAGADLLYGRSGRDSLYGSDGRDRLFGQRGVNRLDGGANRDRCRGGSRVSTLLRCEW